MDARVNDFLNEIDEIAPLSNETKEECVWEKCFDEDSGYYYYWNTESNEVTWDMPADYKASPKSKIKKSGNLYMPPRTAPLFPSTIPPAEAIKIYKIGECADSIPTEKKMEKTKILDRKIKDEDEKIVLISSYGGTSESETDEQKPLGNSVSKSEEEDEDDTDSDILSIIQKKAKELKQLGGEIPSEVKNIVKENQSNKTKLKEICGFSLIAGYSECSDSEQESDTETSKSPPPIENKISHSTLFPITKTPDVKEFEVVSKSLSENNENSFDSKAFQRKKRIGVALVNTGKKQNFDDINRKGLGFTEDSNSNSETPVGTPYPGFTSGGVMFIKSDVLNPSNVETTESEGVYPDIEITYSTLKEKLKFLSEGRESVSPVQAMLIQIETLYTALKAGGLKKNYLSKWLEETCSDLVKLEKETAPEGWLLQWDRSHKRYYYQNAASGESQWEYPQADVTVCDEAMDICTTPPPSEPTIHISPPLPPIIGSPSPPPPPTISDCKSSIKQKCDIPLPPAREETITNSIGEPLPPGVDAIDVKPKTKDNGKESDFNDILNSFYSDIAAIETNTNSNSPPSANIVEDTKIPEITIEPPIKKKKKSKVKLAQGIAMKKKGVSKLVEKWKNVQLSYND